MEAAHLNAVRDAIAKAVQLEDFVGADDTNECHPTEWLHNLGSNRVVSVDNGWCDIELGTVTTRNLDETRETFTPDPDEPDDPELATNVPTVGGQREFNITVRVCRHSQEPGEEAVGFKGGKLRTRMRRADVLAILKAAGVAFVWAGSTFNGDYLDANRRWVSCSVTDMRFRCVETDTDDSEGSGDWVRSMEAEGTMEDLAGNETEVVVDTDE